MSTSPSRGILYNCTCRARRPAAPGLSIVTVLAIFGCATSAPPIVVVEAEPDPVEPAIEDGLYTAAQVSEIALLLAQARSALEQEDFELAEASALEMEAEYSTVPGSGYALWIRARATKGLDKPEESLEAVRRFRAYVREGDERVAEMALLEGDALLALGRTAEAVAAWLTPVDEPVSEEVLARVEDHVRELTICLD